VVLPVVLADLYVADFEGSVFNLHSYPKRSS